jgi:hypothetical protein
MSNLAFAAFMMLFAAFALYLSLKARKAPVNVALWVTFGLMGVAVVAWSVLRFLN